jgi:hypothetical protein
MILDEPIEPLREPPVQIPKKRARDPEEDVQYSTFKDLLLLDEPAPKEMRVPKDKKLPHRVHYWTDTTTRLPRRDAYRIHIPRVPEVVQYPEEPEFYDAPEEPEEAPEEAPEEPEPVFYDFDEIAKNDIVRIVNTKDDAYFKKYEGYTGVVVRPPLPPTFMGYTTDWKADWATVKIMDSQEKLNIPIKYLMHKNSKN